MKRILFIAGLSSLVLVAGSVYASGVFSIEAEKWFNSTCIEGGSKPVKGINASVCDLRDKVIALELTDPVPGPQGEQGPKGDKGDPGESGSVRHVYDANNQDLGELITLSDGDNHIVTLLPGIGYLTLNPAKPNNQIITSHNISGMYFTEYGCQGDAFMTGEIPLLPQTLVRVNTPLIYVTFQTGTLATRVSKSARGWGGTTCSESENTYDNTYLLNLITLPFTEPLPWPLEIR